MVETDTGAKGEYAGRVLKSTHTYTRIDQGTLQLTEAADAAFGKNITVKGGATLSLEGTASTLTVDTLTLGDGNGTATLVLDAGDKVYVENGGNVADPLSSAGGAVSASWATTNGSYPVFYVKGDVGARYLVDMLCDWVAIYGGSSSKDYIWSAAYDDVSGYTVASVEVGNQGEFSKILTFESAGGGVTVTTNGTGRVFSVVTATTTSSHGEDLPLAASTAVDVSTDATLTLGGDLTGRDVRLTKIGSGELDLTGDNTGFTGTIVVNGGRTVVEDKTALGGMNPVTLKSGTFKFAAGDTSGVEPLCLAIETSANKVMPIVEVAENATFTATEVSHTQGGLVKTGAGTLALDLPAGTHTVIKNNGNENNPDSSVSLPATGDSPADVSAFSALTVLEGALNVQGEGADKTFVKFSDPVLIGGQYAGSSPAVLTLNDVEMSTDGKHISFGRKVPNGGFASELHMTNAVFRTNKLEVGHDGATPSLEFLVDMKDSTLVDNYKIQFGWGNARVKIIADNSRIESTGNEGVVVGGFISAVFNGENAGLASTMQPATGKGGLVTVHNQSYGQGVPMRFENGARLAVSQGLYFQNDNVNNGYISVVFDDGVFEVLPSTAEQNFRSRMAQPQNQGFTVENGGLEIDIAENVNHYITFPIRGEGSVVKTGEGVLYLTESYNLNTPSTEKLLQYTGGTVVSNGTLVVDGSLVDGAKSFEVAKGATLDLNKTTLAGATIAGAGVVTNGTLSAATLAYDSDALPTFSGVAFKGALIVDFGRTEDNPLDIDEASAGISIARYTGEAPVNLRVKAINTGIQRARAAVDFVGGVIVMKVDQTGFLMIVR